MKKFLLTSAMTAAFAAFALTAQAISWAPRPTDNLNLEENPGGVSSIEILNSTPLRINRACSEYATLEKNGVVEKQIPASNKVAVYTFDGFDKTDAGSLHITFWDTLLTSPYKYTGTYKVTIPAGYFFFADGSQNEEISAEWGIDNAQFVLTPATGSTVNELKTVKLDFPGAEKVEFVTGGYTPETPNTEKNENRNIFYTYDPLQSEASEDGTAPQKSPEIVPVIDGTTATITMPEDYKSGIVSFTFRKGAFNVWYEGNEKPSQNYFGSAKYTIINSTAEGDNAGYTVTPEPGEVYQIPSFPVTDKVGDSEVVTEAYFIVYPPKDKTIGLVSIASARLYEVVNGERSKTAIKTFLGKKYNQGNGIMFYIAGQSEAAAIKLPAGEYQLVVSKDADWTNRSPELVYNYTFLPSETPVVTKVTPANDNTLTEPIEKVTVEFPEAKNVTLKKGTYATVNLGTIEFTADVALTTVDEHPAIEITPYAPFAQKGTYVFNVPGANLNVDGVNYTINISYDVDTESTIVETVATPESVNVYAVDGRVVVRNASVNTLKSLNPGLYIINGKKVLIRK